MNDSNISSSIAGAVSVSEHECVSNGLLGQYFLHYFMYYVFYRHGCTRTSSPQWNDSQYIISSVPRYVCHSVEFVLHILHIYAIIIQLPNQFTVHRLPRIDYKLLIIPELLQVNMYSMVYV